MTRAFWLIPERLNLLRTLYIPVHQHFTRLPWKRNGKNVWLDKSAAYNYLSMSGRDIFCGTNRRLLLVLLLLHRPLDAGPSSMVSLLPGSWDTSDAAKKAGPSSRLFTLPILYTLPSASQKTSKVEDILRLWNLCLHPHHLFLCLRPLYKHLLDMSIAIGSSKLNRSKTTSTIFFLELISFSKPDLVNGSY